MLNLQTLESQLEALELDLHRKIAGGASDEFASSDRVIRIKSAIDRIRPLLWIYLHRQGAPLFHEQAANTDVPRKSSASQSMPVASMAK